MTISELKVICLKNSSKLAFNQIILGKSQDGLLPYFFI
jgi:hypothetical protein